MARSGLHRERHWNDIPSHYVIAQVIQEAALRHGINEAATGEQGIQSLRHLRISTGLQPRAVPAILLSFFPILVAFAAVALRRVRRSPAASVLGFTFSLLFVTAEVSTRSIDLFLVSNKWATEYHSASSPAIQQLIAGRIQLWEQSVGAFYFVLLAGHLLASTCFAIATWDDYRWNRIVAIAFLLNALRLTSRVAEGYLGQSWLDPVNNAVYFPTVALIFGTLTAWLWKQTRMVRNEQEARRTV